MSEVELVMPRLSDSMDEGTILRWLKAEGEHVARGEEVVEIETDKATMAYASDGDGFLRILAAEGQTLPIGAPIAGLASEPPHGPAADRDSPAIQARPGPPPGGPPASRDGAAIEADPDRPDAPPPPDARRVRASPLARRIARECGVELAAVAGSGPGGRVIRADVEAAAEAGEPPDLPAAEPDSCADPVDGTPVSTDSASGKPVDRAAAPVGAGTGTAREVETVRGIPTVLEPTRAQRAVARRMAESRATVPDFTVSVEVEMTEAAGLREGLGRVAGENPVPSLNDMVVRACAMALREFPHVNASYRDGRFELHPRVHVGIAVADQDHLTVPVIHDTDHHSLGELARVTRALAGRVRTGTITPPELAGATFTVSNLGMLGADRFTAIITPPQAAILAVGAARPRPVVRDGALAAGVVMELTMACDHRILYGAEAARFLARLRELLQQPLGLV